MASVLLGYALSLKQGVLSLELVITFPLAHRAELPLYRLQRGDGGVQEHQFHCLGCGWPGQGGLL